MSGARARRRGRHSVLSVLSVLKSVPPMRTALIGREHEVASVRDLVLGGRGRLVTLTGAGGCGKTRLGYADAAERLRAVGLTPLSPADRTDLARRLEPARRTPPGKSLSTSEAVALARSTVLEPTSRSHPTPAPAHLPLTPREREVHALIGQGFSNRQIADELVISLHTAQRHLENILSKLGFASRTQVGIWASDHGLVVMGQ